CSIAAVQTLRLYCDVASFRSFSRAAVKHGITQPAVSQRIRQLEKHLGVVLIDRAVRPLGLTAAGELFLRECRKLLDRYDQLEQEVAELRPGPSGEVRVEAIYSAGIDLLNDVRAALGRRWPGVTVTLEYKRPEEVHQAVRDGHCDLGILSYPQRWRDVGILPLWNERMAVICSPQHPLAQRASVQASELGPWSLVTFESGLPVGWAIRRYLREQGVSPKISNVFDNIDTIKHVVAVTDEFSILPKRTVRREGATGSLTVVELEPDLDRPMGVIYRRVGPSSRRFSPAGQAFVDCLLEHAAADGKRPTRAKPTDRQLVGDKA
ncbi:LysR family transcriptional regulator, partial [Acidobacteria bacterium AH-259-G07]|nr:LysR family transcriptional regulator [Acidobacteria bacterium AH-259-G07]